MNIFLEHYWPHILAALSLLLGLSASIHVAMTKKEVRTAIGWVGVIILSPILGAVIYGLFGINRIRNRLIEEKHLFWQEEHQDILSHFQSYKSDNDSILQKFGANALSQKILGDNICQNALMRGNIIHILEDGDRAYSAMLNAINKAQSCIILESYIFNRDSIGKAFVEALAKAVLRGVNVRVLIDAVGARYSIPTIVGALKRHNVPVAVFNGNIIIGLRLPYANLRTHRKILVVDNQIAFMGGLNIRANFSKKINKKKTPHDTHFQITGPTVLDLFHIAANDWYFATNESLHFQEWPLQKPHIADNDGIYARVVASGPTRQLIGKNQNMLIGAFSIAKEHIRIMTPYLLPDREFISALTTAARRGVKVDIIVPEHNNLFLVDRAMWAQFDQLLADGCQIWRAQGQFNHSKLITIDNSWSYIGSSNLDSRSLRLNFEVDLEVYDSHLSQQIAKKMEKTRKNSRLVVLKNIKKRPFLLRLFDKIIWLGSPYL